ncbi:MAG TPA: hypothetical protein VJP79_09320 [Nitrososphaera sp.]|nr:hypothetical protein [Nitrososphaera sp.]
MRDLSYKIRKTELRMRNKKAKRDIPRLEEELRSLRNAYDQTLRGNMPGVVKDNKRPVQPRLCPICNERLGKGYHICKPRHLLPATRRSNTPIDSKQPARVQVSTD